MNRERLLDEIQARRDPFDFCIVGGGATGLGAAVDAAARGHSVVLIEQADFAKGTSSRSTKLVHGGVRYLKQGNLALVLDALRERGLLARNAPHLVHDTAFVIPCYSVWEKWFYGVGLKIYDLLAGRLSLGRSRMLSREETIGRIPTIKADRLTGGVLYHDGQFDDSRLAVNLAQTAGGLGGKVVNYVRCIGLVKEGDEVAGVHAEDRESGRQFVISARCVINATGIFVDELRVKDAPGIKPIVTVSQGIHMVLPKRFLPGGSAIMIPKTADGRVLFALPWHGRVVIGTTDTPVVGTDLEPRALKEEKEFVMEHAAKYLNPAPGAGDVLSVFAGLRPLVKSGEGTHTAALSRDHTLEVSESGLLTVTGGKWTTYRKIAEEVIDRGERLAKLPPSGCKTVPLKLRGWTLENAGEDRLKVYGADAPAIRKLGADEKIHPSIDLTVGEVIWHVREEMARTVEDVLSRRSRYLLLDARGSIEAAPSVARLMAAELGEGEDWIKRQIADYGSLARGYLLDEFQPATR